MTAATPVHCVASAVALDGRGLILLGPGGSGKSELALGLIETGAALIGDDGVRLSVDGDRVMVAPTAAFHGNIMLRDIGLARAAHVVSGPVPLSLAVMLDPLHPPAAGAPRLGAFGPVSALFVPQWTVHPGTPAILAKLRLALDRWGL